VYVPGPAGEKAYEGVEAYVVATPKFARDGRTGAFKPSPVYKKLMVCAAASRGLPEEYVAALEALETQ
jgi:hypothetical protein